MRPLMLAGALASLLTRVTPATHQVNVGQIGIVYVPNTTVANIGDQVQFNFYNIHSVVEGGFNFPCLPLPGGFYSGMISAPFGATSAAQQFIVTINDTKPHYFYCAQLGQCAGGMVGVINPPSADDLQEWAKASTRTDPNASPESISPPNAPIGGIIKNLSESNAAASTGSDLSFPFELTAFTSGSVAASMNASAVPTGIISDTTVESVATSGISNAASSTSRVSNATPMVTVPPTSSASSTSTTSATTPSQNPSASTTSNSAAAGMARVDAAGLAILYLVCLYVMMLIGV